MHQHAIAALPFVLYRAPVQPPIVDAMDQPVAQARDTALFGKGAGEIVGFPDKGARDITRAQRRQRRGR
jgi:hypothetical protein